MNRLLKTLDAWLPVLVIALIAMSIYTNLTRALINAKFERRIERLEMIARHLGYEWETPDDEKAKDLMLFSEPPSDTLRELKDAGR